MAARRPMKVAGLLAQNCVLGRAAAPYIPLASQKGVHVLSGGHIDRRGKVGSAGRNWGQFLTVPGVRASSLDHANGADLGNEHENDYEIGNDNEAGLQYDHGHEYDYDNEFDDGEDDYDDYDNVEARRTAVVVDPLELIHQENAIWASLENTPEFAYRRSANATYGPLFLERQRVVMRTSTSELASHQFAATLNGANSQQTASFSSSALQSELKNNNVPRVEDKAGIAKADTGKPAKEEDNGNHVDNAISSVASASLSASTAAVETAMNMMSDIKSILGINNGQTEKGTNDGDKQKLVDGNEAKESKAKSSAKASKGDKSKKKQLKEASQSESSKNDENLKTEIRNNENHKIVQGDTNNVNNNDREIGGADSPKEPVESADGAAVDQIVPSASTVSMTVETNNNDELEINLSQSVNNDDWLDKRDTPSIFDLFDNSSTERPQKSYVFGCGASAMPKKMGLKTIFPSGNSDDFMSGQAGEDAFFVRSDALGVADGVGGWASIKGANPALYSRKLMHYVSQQLDTIGDISGVDYDSDLDHQIMPKKLIDVAYTQTMIDTKKERFVGSTTVLVVVLRGDELRIANLGDCGLMIIRNMEAVFRTEEQQHSFNFPYQLGTGSRDSPKDSQEFNVKIEEGDIVILGTDGMFDNVFDEDVVAIVQSYLRSVGGTPSSLDPQKITDALLRRAREVAEDTRYASCPFQSRAIDEGVYYQGGKMDDITVVVGIVKMEEDSPDRR